MEILVVILVFALPLVSVLLDKKKKNVPKVKSRRIVWPEDRPAAPGPDGIPAPGPQVTGRKQADAQGDRPGAHVRPETADAQAAAAAFMNSARSTRSKAEESQSGKKKEYSEKQKLIIYSEILKPKFDE